MPLKSFYFFYCVTNIFNASGNNWRFSEQSDSQFQHRSTTRVIASSASFSVVDDDDDDDSEIENY